MEFFELINARRSCRKFKNDPLPEEIIEKIIQAAIAAPSAGNLQGFRILVTSDKETLARLAKAAYGQSSLKTCPAALVFVAEPKRSGARYGKRGEELYALQDATIAATFAHLAAYDLGIGSVWVGAFEDNAAAQAIGVAAPDRIAAIIPIGYPDENINKTPRRDYKDIVTRFE